MLKNPQIQTNEGKKMDIQICTTYSKQVLQPKDVEVVEFSCDPPIEYDYVINIHTCNTMQSYTINLMT